MLNLNPRQMSQLDTKLEPARDAAMIAYARRRFGADLRGASDACLLQAVQQARRLALGWGIVDERDVATVFDLAVMYGADFGQSEWATDILQARDRTGSDKAEALRARVRRTVAGF